MAIGGLVCGHRYNKNDIMYIPNTPDEFTVEWMNRALAPHLGAARVTDLQAAAHATPGQTADIVSIKATYDGESALPTAFIAKVTARDESTMENVVKPLDLYYKEYCFYEESIEGIRYPRCYHAAYDPDGCRLVLLFEDISHLDSPSWNPSLEQVELAVDKLAPFHARWWNDESLKRRDWLSDAGALLAMYADLAHAAIPAVDDLLDEDASYTHELVRGFVEHREGALRHLRTRPFTFVHGDYHPKQMFFGERGTEQEFVMIDWQLPFRGPGANDLARIIALGFDTEGRRRHEPRLMQRYMDLLREHGVEDYTMEDLLEDYVAGIFTSVSIHYLAAATNVQLFIDEVSALGLDWQDVANYRLRNALEDHGGHRLLDVWRRA